jgi:methionine sulfoxide reductase heme-binding subunit
MTRRSRILLKTGVWILCLLPFLLLVRRTVVGDLGPNPISFLTNWLGQWTFRFLLLTLALTPMRICFGLAWPLLLRRLIGLFTFFYASLHFLIWILVDHFFDWDQMLGDILKRRYITVGMLALCLLVPLALTSTSGMIRRLGGTAWRRLHRLVYVVGALACLHFLWLSKAARPDAYAYTALVILFLGIRLWNALARSRRRRSAVERPTGASQPSLSR